MGPLPLEQCALKAFFRKKTSCYTFGGQVQKSSTSIVAEATANFASPQSPTNKYQKELQDFFG